MHQTHDDDGTAKTQVSTQLTITTQHPTQMNSNASFDAFKALTAKLVAVPKSAIEDERSKSGH